jgi:hypothetical protein
VFAKHGSDLEGLRDYDSNGDGLLTADDDGFELFVVWRDANSNGVADEGEMQSLTDLGITGISLTSDGVIYSAAGGDVMVVGTGGFTRSDGSTGVLADAVFATGGAVQQEQARSVTAANNNAALLGAIAAAGLVAAEPLAAATILSSSQQDGETPAGALLHNQAFAPVALDLVSSTSVSVVVELAGDSAQPSTLPGAGTPVDSQLTDVASDSSGAIPSVLLAGTDVVHQQIAEAAPFTAASIAVPSADQLSGIANGNSEPVQHNQIVGKVLVEALAGGGWDAPSVDALLDGLPGATASAADLLASHSSQQIDSEPLAMFGGFMAHAPLGMEQMIVHHDAATQV